MDPGYTESTLTAHIDKISGGMKARSGLKKRGVYNENLAGVFFNDLVIAEARLFKLLKFIFIE